MLESRVYRKVLCAISLRSLCKGIKSWQNATSTYFAVLLMKQPSAFPCRLLRVNICPGDRTEWERASYCFVGLDDRWYVNIRATYFLSAAKTISFTSYYNLRSLIKERIIAFRARKHLSNISGFLLAAIGAIRLHFICTQMLEHSVKMPLVISRNNHHSVFFCTFVLFDVFY